MSARDKLINLFKSNQHALVINEYKKVSSIFDNDDQILCIIALSYSHLKKYDDAATNFLKAYSLTGNIDYKYNLALSYSHANDYNLAIETYEQIISQHENHLSTLINLSDLYIGNKSYSSAIKLLRDKVQLYTDNISIAFNYALALSGNRKFNKSIELYNKILDLKPDYRDALYNLANCYREIAKFDIAIKIYKKLIDRNCNDYESKFNLGVCYFMIDDYKNGLKLYESRYNLAIHSNPNIHLSGKSLLSDSSFNKNSSIVIIHEQGFGDTINFSYFLNEIKNIFNKVQVLIQPELHQLFCQSFNCDFYVDGNKLNEYDYYIFSCSLPIFFSQKGLSLQSRQPFLTVSKSKQDKWKSLIGNTGKRKIGISWTSQKETLVHRSIDYYEFLQCLPSTNDYYCLHKVISHDEDEFIKSKSNFFQFCDKLTDFHDTAALCQCLDEIVTIDTSVAHLCLGLGLKTTLLLSHVPDWRWGYNRDDSIWYPKIQIFRQNKPDDWSQVLDRVYNLLK